MEIKKNPYFDIQLSTATDSEEEYQTYLKFLQKREGKKKKIVLSAKSKKYEQLNQIESLIDEALKNSQYEKLKNELDNMQNFISKNQDFVIKYGTPKSFLRVLNLLNKSIYQEDLENKELEKSDLKALKFLKQKLKQKFEQHQNEIDQAIQNQNLDQNEVSEHEEGEKIGTDNDDEEKELNFNDRLKLSKEDRRKFWMVKEKQQKVVKKKGKSKHQYVQNQTQVKRQFLEDNEEFQQINFKFLDKVLRKINSEKQLEEQEKINYNLKQLEFIQENLKQEKIQNQVENYDNRNIETILLITHFMMEQGEEQGVFDSDLLQRFFEQIRYFQEILERNEELSPINYDRGEQKLSKNEVFQRFHNLVSKLNEEFDYGLRLIDPFQEQFLIILHQKISFFLNFLDDLKQFYNDKINDEKIQTFYICDVYFKQLEHIYHLSNDFVLNCEQLSEYFEGTLISDKVQELSEYLLKNLKDNIKIIKTQLWTAFNKALNNEDEEQVEKTLNDLFQNKQVQNQHELVAYYNRALCKLGISYFKKGDFIKSKKLLSGICNSGQIQQNLYQYNPQKQRIIDLDDPLNTIPFYMHLNVDEIDILFLINCVLLDSHKTFKQNQNQNVQINKRFSKFLKTYEINTFVNSRNNNKDCIFVSFRKIIQGDYLTAIEALKDISYVQDIEKTENLVKKVKEESFLCYVEKMKTGDQITLNLQDLANIFELPIQTIQNILEQKMKNQELSGKIEDNLIKIENNEESIFQNDSEWNLLYKSMKFFNYTNEEEKLIKQACKINHKKMNPMNSIISQNFAYQQGPFSFAQKFDFNTLKKEYIN